jgi:hypothetical protein
MVLTLCLDEEKNVLSLNFDFFFFYIFTLHVIVGASEQKNAVADRPRRETRHIIY